MHMYLENSKKTQEEQFTIASAVFHVLPDDLFGGCVTYIYTNIFSMYDMI